MGSKHVKPTTVKRKYYITDANIYCGVTHNELRQDANPSNSTFKYIRSHCLEVGLELRSKEQKSEDVRACSVRLQRQANHNEPPANQNVWRSARI
jgi:hypothetical protein